MIIELFAVLLVSWAIQKWVLPKAKQTQTKREVFAQLNLPHAEEASPLPIFYGQVRITGPAVIAARHFSSDPVKQEINGDDVVSAYQYRIFLQFLLGAPGKSAGAGAPSRLKAFWIGERRVWMGEMTHPEDVRYIKNLELFGGKLAGGGVEGVMSYLPGSATQTNNALLKKILGKTDNADPIGMNTDLAYRSQAVVSLWGIKGDGIHTSDVTTDGYYFRHGAQIAPGTGNPHPQIWLVDGPGGETIQIRPYFLDGTTIEAGGLDFVEIADQIDVRGWMLGESSQLDGYSWEAMAPTYTTLDGNLVGPIGKDANPICALYDLLTNPWDRLGRDPTTIDEQSFYAAAVTLRGEGNGFSLVFSQAVDSRDAVKVILDQIDGVLYDDYSTGTLKIRLIREDYVVADLDLLDESNVLEVVEWQVGTWEGTVNQIRVTFTERANRYKTAPAVQHDMANYYATGSKWRSKDIAYPGCTTKANADKLAARDLRTASLPLAKLKLAVNRDAYTKRPGDVFRFTWSDYDGVVDYVFRVLKYDLGKPGTPDAERVILDCVQDRFAFRRTVFRLPIPPTRAIPKPYLPTDRHVTEAPLWLALRAELAGRIVDSQAGARRLYLAAPRARATAMNAEVAPDGADVTATDYAQDIEPQPYPGRARVSVAYGRELDPYDNTTGLVIEQVEGWLPENADPADIKLFGKNLLLLVEDDGSEEFITFETATDNGDGTWTLGNVSRGDLDTSAIDHAIGARVWAMSIKTGAQVTRVGRVSFDYGQTHVIRHAVRGLGAIASTSAAPSVDVEIVTPMLRIALPYPVADLNLMCSSVEIGDTLSKAPAELVEGAVDMTWLRRNRLSPTIVRGNDPDQAPEADTFFVPIGKYTVEDGENVQVWDLLDASLDYTNVGALSVPIGNAGFGLISIGPRAEAPLRASNPAAPTNGISYTDAVIDVNAPHWRNQAVNGRLSDEDVTTDPGVPRGWDYATATGSPIVRTSSSGLGGGRYYLTNGSEDDISISQTIKVLGYIPNNLRSTVHVYYHLLSAVTSPTIRLTVETLDDAGVVLQSGNTGDLAMSTAEWRKAVYEIANMDPLVASIRCTVSTSGCGVTPQVAITELIVRLGELATVAGATQLLTNPDFESGGGSLTGWTVDSGGFLAYAGGLGYMYLGTHYALGGDFATCEMHQDVAVPTGWGQGTDAVLEFARYNRGGSDTGEVIIEARNGGGAVLASATTGAEVIGGVVWVRRRLALSLPVGTATVRVRVIAVRVVAPGADAGFDDFDLRLHKHLACDVVNAFDLDVPTSQPVPPDYDFFDRAWPDVAPPTLAFYNGADVAGVRGTEPTLELMGEDEGITTATAPATVGAVFTGAYDATRGGAVTAFAYDFPPLCDAGYTVSDPDFAAFASTDPFSVFIELKSSSDVFGAVLCGRIGDSTYGWELTINSITGFAVARLLGTGGTVEATGTLFIADRAVRAIGMVYDPSVSELRLIDAGGVVIASTAALGEIEDTSAMCFRVGYPTASGSVFQGQIANLFMWSEAKATADIQSMITQGGLPDSHFVQDRTDGTLATIVGNDGAGVLVSRFGKDQVAWGWSSELETDGGNGVGFPHQLQTINRIADAMQGYYVGDWHAIGTTTPNAGFGVEGTQNSIITTGDNTGGVELRGITAGAVAAKCVAFFARAPSPTTTGTKRLALNNAADVNKGNFDFVVTEAWQIFWHTFNAWDNSTPTCRLRWMGSDSGVSSSVEICGPFYLSETDVVLVAIPISTSDSVVSGYNSATLVLAGGEAMTYQHTAEGELAVTGVAPVEIPPSSCGLMQLSSGGVSDDYRVVFPDHGGKPNFFHHATGDNTAEAGVVAWDTVWTIRGRWCQAGLLDTAGKYTSVVFGDELSAPVGFGRTAHWVDTGNALDTIMFGSSEIGDPMPALIRRVVVRSRERRLIP